MLHSISNLDQIPRESYELARENPSSNKRIAVHRLIAALAILDCGLLTIIGFLALWLSGYTTGLSLSEVLDKVEAHGIYIGVIVFVTTQHLLRGYQAGSVVVRGWSVRKLLMALLITFGTLILLAVVAKVSQSYSRLWFGLWVGLSVVVLPVVRLIIIERKRLALSKGAYVNRALSVGVADAPLAPSDIAMMSAGLSFAFRSIALESPAELATLAKALCEQNVDELYVRAPWRLAQRVFEEVRQLRHLSLNIFVVPSDGLLDASVVSARMRLDKLEIQMQSRPIDGWSLLQKRTCDILVSSLALLVFAPVMVLVAIAIKWESPGPIFFRQPRSGLNGQTFELLKFRSMFSNMADAGAVRQTSRGDARVTRVGRFIRKTSLDELPQLINVLKGDMSVVGPRPHALATTAEGQALDKIVRDYASRHRVRPGMTGWAQVNGLRGELDSVEKLKRRVQFDLEYIEKWSLALDLKVLCRTVLILLYDPTAY